MTGPAAALVGGQVVIATSTAARIAPVLRAAADRARCNGLPLDDDLVQLLAVLTAAERQHLRRPPTVAATTLAPDGCAAPSSGQVLDAGEVARRARVSVQAVRKAAATGRLVGRVGPDGRWWFEEQAVTEWLATRRRSA
jgi:hypothetical protein